MRAQGARFSCMVIVLKLLEGRKAKAKWNLGLGETGRSGRVLESVNSPGWKCEGVRVCIQLVDFV